MRAAGGGETFVRMFLTVLLLLFLTGLPAARAWQASSSASVRGALPQPDLFGDLVTCHDVYTQTDENAPVTVDVLANCQLILNGIAQLGGLHVQSVTQPSQGTARINPDNTITYNPNQNFFGQDSFQFTAADLTGLLTGSANVFITVNAVSSTTTTTISTRRAFGRSSCRW